jgi:hypothetical protein
LECFGIGPLCAEGRPRQGCGAFGLAAWGDFHRQGYSACCVHELGLGKLRELHDIARDLERNVRNSWIMIIVPNILCILGVFTLSFGMGAAVVTNNVAALRALANAL